MTVKTESSAGRMTEMEAIKDIKENILPCVGGKSLVLAIKALEKQIPKKPVCIEDKMWCCPVCNNHLLHKWIKYQTKLMPRTEGIPYCMSCGQAIDWSDEE